MVDINEPSTDSPADSPTNSTGSPADSSTDNSDPDFAAFGRDSQDPQDLLPLGSLRLPPNPQRTAMLEVSALLSLRLVPIYPCGHEIYRLPSRQKHEGKLPILKQWQDVPPYQPAPLSLKDAQTKEQITAALYGYAAPSQTPSPTINQTSAPEGYDRLLPNLSDPDYCNLGFIPPPNMVILDVDTKRKSKGADSIQQLNKDLGINLLNLATFIVKTPSGGVHLYFSKDPQLMIYKTLKQYPGIDFLSSHIDHATNKTTNGTYCLLPSSKAPINSNAAIDEREYAYYTVLSTRNSLYPLAPIPQSLMDILARAKAAVGMPTDRNPATDMPYDDSAANVSHATALCKNRSFMPIPQSGVRNNTYYLYAARLRDMAISPLKALELLETHVNHAPENTDPLTNEEMTSCVRNAYTYASQPIGNKHPSTMFSSMVAELSPLQMDPTTYMNTDTQPLTITASQNAQMPTATHLPSLAVPTLPLTTDQLPDTMLTPSELASDALPAHQLNPNPSLVYQPTQYTYQEEHYNPACTAWWANVEMSASTGSPKPRSRKNAVLFLTNLPELHGLVRKNRFANNLYITRPAPWFSLTRRSDAALSHDLGFPPEGVPWTDEDTNQLADFLEHYYFPLALSGTKGCSFGREMLEEALDIVASRRSYHPVQESLERALENWDGVPRLDNWLSTYVKASKNRYTKEVSRLVILGAIARVYNPGQKFDYMLILEGKQRRGKSMICEALAMNPSWFNATKVDLDDPKQFAEALMGTWIYEFAELDALAKHDQNVVKMQITNRKDKVRLAYGRRTEDLKRQTIFVGTTNEDQYLTDRTGNTRFLPVKIEESGSGIDIDGFARDIPHIYAEGLKLYKENIARLYKEGKTMDDYKITLSPEGIVLAEQEQTKRLVQDQRAELVSEYLDGKHDGHIWSVRAKLEGKKAVVVAVSDVADILGIRPKEMSVSVQKMIDGLMQQLGWVKPVSGVSLNNQLIKRYYRDYSYM